MHDAVVVGAGIMGASAAYALAGAGRGVLLLERFRVGHDRGSSHGDARVFRLSYDDPGHVRMAGEALAGWRRLEEETGKTLLITTGGLDLGERSLANAEALREAGVAHEVLAGEDAAGRFPGVAVPEGTPAVHQSQAGWVAAEAAWRALAQGAIRRGAQLRDQTPVVGLRPSADGVSVRTEEGAISARVAVVTAGAWARGLLTDIGVDLPVTVTRETPVFFRLRERAALPVVLEWRDPPLYALPSPDYGLKAAEHHAGPVVDPDEGGGPDRDSVRRVSRWVAERFPAADPEPVAAQTCLYTSTRDERFILERHGSVVVGSPCSGHGFKFAPVIGERLAALAS